MINDLKYYDGSVQQIERIPQELKDLYATAFEVETKWIVDAASRRQKWIDQAQSLNLYIAGASGKKLDVTYRMAWYRGLKTTYYLRALAATSTEKSTINTGKLNAVSSGGDSAPVRQRAQPRYLRPARSTSQTAKPASNTPCRGRRLKAPLAAFCIRVIERLCPLHVAFAKG